jgi:phenylpropionate dioxygenase-like ring-hydroxylating dioxygenase large terminal subunit
MSKRDILPISAFDSSTTGHDHVVALPPAAFTDESFYRFELDAIWGREWFCIGHAADIPNAGDYFTVIVGDDPLLAVRQQDGSVRVLANVCQHRGQQLAEGRGNTRRIRCPMHSWLYDLSGQLLSAPGLNDDPSFRKSDACLPAIRSELWENLVFVTFDDSIPPLAPRLANLKEQLANYRLTELVPAAPLQFDRLDCNWKHFADECYHCPSLHGQSWGKMYPTTWQTVDEEAIYNDLVNGIFAYDLIGPFPDASPTRTGRALQPILPDLTEHQRQRLAYISVVPNLLIVGLPDKVKCFIWLPSSANQSQYGVVWLYPRATVAAPDFRVQWEKERADLYPVMEEDYAGWRRYQIGVRSRFAPRGRLSPLEKMMGRHQDWLIDRYRRADAARRASHEVK